METVQESVLAHLKNDETNSPADQYSVAYQLTIDNMNLQSKVIFRKLLLKYQPIRYPYFRKPFLMIFMPIHICQDVPLVENHKYSFILPVS